MSGCVCTERDDCSNKQRQSVLYQCVYARRETTVLVSNVSQCCIRVCMHGDKLFSWSATPVSAVSGCVCTDTISLVSNVSQCCVRVCMHEDRLFPWSVTSSVLCQGVYARRQTIPLVSNVSQCCVRVCMHGERLSLVSLMLLLFASCLTSQQHAGASQGRIFSDNYTRCHIEIKVANQVFYLVQFTVY